MRVVAGRCRGRRLKSVPGSDTRPTTDRVKEAMFSILAPYLGQGLVLDLFAGTGALGIESLSRGMDFCIFVEQAGRAIEVVKENIQACGLQEQSEVLRMNAKRAIEELSKRNLKFDLIFLDPPYRLQAGPQMISDIQAHQLHGPETVYVVEHSSADVLPETIHSAVRFRQSQYGEITLSFYREGNESL